MKWEESNIFQTSYLTIVKVHTDIVDLKFSGAISS